MLVKSVKFVFFMRIRNGGIRMLSKNNKKLQTEKMEPKRQRFAIKKFTVGVASVLIGTTFSIYAGTTMVSANENNAEPTELVADGAGVTTEESSKDTQTSEADKTTNEVAGSDAVAQNSVATDPITPASTDNAVASETVAKAQATSASNYATEKETPTSPTTQANGTTETVEASSVAPQTSAEASSVAPQTSAEATTTSTESLAQGTSFRAATEDATPVADTETKDPQWPASARSEEHTSELQSRI